MSAPITASVFERSVRLSLDRFAEKDRPRLVAKAARARIEEAAAHNRRILGHDAPRTEFVDGRRGAAFETVAPGGRIEALFDIAEIQTARMVVDVYETLRRNSPVGPPKNTARRGPHYKDAFMVFVDGERVMPPFTALPKVWRRIVWVNARPYARKIEGVGSLKPLSAQRPNGVVEETMREVRRRWRRFDFRYSFSPVAEFYAAGRLTTARSRRVTLASLTRARSFPAIIVEA